MMGKYAVRASHFVLYPHIFYYFYECFNLVFAARIFDSYYFIKSNVFYYESESYLLANKRRLNLYFQLVK